MTKQTIKVTVKNKDSVVFDEEVHAVSSFNAKGPFDILPLHENFISLIKDKVILHRDGKVKEIALEGGILKVNENTVTIYLGLPTNPLNESRIGFLDRFRQKYFHF